MKTSLSNPMPQRRMGSHLCRLLPTVFLLATAFFVASAFIVTDYKERFYGWRILNAKLNPRCVLSECRPSGTEALPRGIVSKTSNLEMRPLWGRPNQKKSKSPMNLLSIAAGLRQKESVNNIVKKFPSSDFVVMLFHYDGIVNGWMDLEWSSRAIHVSAMNQTKWWFAKRFLHPDIVTDYAYIFLWDEDLGVADFHVGKYLSIIQKEGLEISQPALDPDKSEVHHLITAREKRSKFHRRVYKLSRSGVRCDANSSGPPCTGWVEMMAPVFSKASWRCVWHLIQNDLVHAWGLDFQLGYCAQGNRTKNIGIVDSEYVVHYGLPTLGGVAFNKTKDSPNQASNNNKLPRSTLQAPSASLHPDSRYAVRRQSYIELEIFKNRWKKAIKEDECWTDPYQQVVKPSS